MVRSFTGRKRFRKNFGRIQEVAPLPNLIALQKNSYEAFLQLNVKHEKRFNTGLLEVFSSIFPIKDYSGKAHLEFFHYDFEKPKFDEEFSKSLQNLRQTDHKVNYLFLESIFSIQYFHRSIC